MSDGRGAQQNASPQASPVVPLPPAPRSAPPSTPPSTSPPPDLAVPGSGVRRHRWVRANPAANLLYRAAVAALGTIVVGTGVVLLPLPGPGWLIIFFGLALLATEFAWAQRLLRFARARVADWTAWVTAQGVGVRASLGLGMVLLGAGAAWAALAVAGTPAWLPDGVATALDETLPGIG